MLSGPAAGGAHAWAPFLLPMRGGKIMAQDFLTYAQQIAKLRDDKGLIVTDADEARKILEEIGYYSLIAGYKNLFINPAAKNILMV
jgi:abortive infection bacteriophage resistance protein